MSLSQIKIENKYSDSVDDENRTELLWGSKQEDLLNEWCKKCIITSKSHDIKSKMFKKCHILFSIPSIIIPISISGLTEQLQIYPEVQSLAMIGVGIISGVNSFFDFSKKEERHSQYTNLYTELYNEIRSELSKPKKHRVACDMYLERVKNRLNFLRQSAPDL